MHLPPLRVRSILVFCVVVVVVALISGASLHRYKQRATLMTTAVPPIAARRPFEVVSRFSRENIIDPYHWLRDDSRSSSEVLGYLAAENSYADAYFARLQQQVSQLESAMDAPHPDVELSGLAVHGRHLYYRKRGPGDDYWATYRHPLLLPPQPAAAAAGSNGDRDAAGGSLAQALAAAAAAAAAAAGSSNGDTKEELVLDENELAAGHSYWDAAVVAASPDGSRVAVAFDTRGDECYSLQVFDAASGAPLLQPAISGCAGDAVWWGDSSEVLVFTTEDAAVSDRSRHLVNCLLLPPAAAAAAAAQQQHAAAEAGGNSAARSLLLYAPGPDERRLSLAVTRDRRFLLLTSSVDGGTLVQALQTSQQLAANITSSSTSSSSSPAAADSRPIVPASDWQVVISPDDDLDVLRIDHLGSGSSSASGSSNSSGSSSDSAGASAEQGGVFLAIVDDDDSPDGELLLIDTRHKERRMEVLVRNRRPQSSDSDDSDSDDDGSSRDGGSTDGGSSGSSSDASSADRASAAAAPSSSHPPQQQPQQSLQITDFAVHAAAGIVAVLVRRGGCCSVQIYSLHSGSSNAANSSSSSTQPQQQQQQQVPVVVLQTDSNNSSSSSSTTCAAAAAADSQAAAAAAAAGSSRADAAAAAQAAAAASLEWVLAPQDPTLLLQLEGVLGPADQPWLLLEASGIVAPSSLFAINLLTRQCVKVHEEEVVGFVPGRYASRLEWAPSTGGAAVPLTVAFRRDMLAGDGSNRAILHGYGAYGANKWPSFDPADLALLDRGLVIAWAHVRGGGELGSAWHVAGQRLRKKNTFHDFLAAARHLVSNGYTSHQHLAVWGRSAGGLTVGASLNMEPSFAAVALLDVPFLDVLATMSDPELPLTIKERHEWGDPLSNKAAYAAIRSYTPTLNISPTGRYPALLLTASLHDGRVNYWEPAKFTAAMRHTQQQQQQQGTVTGTDQGSRARPVLFVTDMHAGHFAASAASSRLAERARKVAFIMDCLELQ